MSNETLTIILTALPPTLAALAGLIVGILNSRKSTTIHTLVNSNLDRIKSELQAATSLITQLREELVVLRKLKPPTSS